LLTGYNIDHDYRSFSTSVGTEIDNIFVETVPAVPVIWGLGGGVLVLALVAAGYRRIRFR
jgi:hypothetical protein